MNHFQEKRLTKLADHLLRGKLIHKKFSFNHFNARANGDPEPYKCGTMGCALGECPGIFRKNWKFDVFSHPVLRDSIIYEQEPITDAADFFGISNFESNALFLPSGWEDKVTSWNKTVLASNATRQQVGRSILRFIKWKKAQQEVDKILDTII